MKHLVPACWIAILAVALMVGIVVAQETPEFGSSFKALVDQIPEVVGVPVEVEHWTDNGDLLQQTTTGLMVWQKLTDKTLFTDGITTWVDGPDGVQEKANAEPIGSDSTVSEEPQTTPDVPQQVTPTATQTPAPTPTSTPAIPRVTYTGPNVIRGQSYSGDTAWIFGEIRNEGSIAVYSVSVSGRLLSADGSVAGADTDNIPYLGPGDIIAYELAVKSPASYVRAEIAVNAKLEPSLMGYMKGNVSSVGTRKAGESFRVAGIATNGNGVTLKNMQVRTWLLDGQNNVVDVTTNYFGSDLAPGGSTNFDEESRSTRTNPKVGTTTQGKAYVFGYK